jgi:hypothetical protein
MEISILFHNNPILNPNVSLGVPLRTSIELSHEQLLVYYNVTAHLINYKYGQPVVLCRVNQLEINL